VRTLRGILEAKGQLLCAGGVEDKHRCPVFVAR
jgi:hypothetical protein